MILSDCIANLHQPFAILMLCVAAVCFAIPLYAGARSKVGFWLVFLSIVGISAVIECLVFVVS